MLLEVAKSILVVAFILWCIFYFVGFKIKKKISNDEKIIYECGFKNFNNINMNANINFINSMCLVLLYEMEILFILPVGLNTTYSSPQTFFFLLLFLTILTLSLIVDKFFNVVKWVY